MPRRRPPLARLSHANRSSGDDGLLMDRSESAPRLEGRRDDRLNVQSHHLDSYSSQCWTPPEVSRIASIEGQAGSGWSHAGTNDDGRGTPVRCQVSVVRSPSLVCPPGWCTRPSSTPTRGYATTSPRPRSLAPCARYRGPAVHDAHKGLCYSLTSADHAPLHPASNVQLPASNLPPTLTHSRSPNRRPTTRHRGRDRGNSARRWRRRCSTNCRPTSDRSRHPRCWASTSPRR